VQKKEVKKLVEEVCGIKLVRRKRVGLGFYFRMDRHVAIINPQWLTSIQCHHHFLDAFSSGKRGSKFTNLT